MPYVKHYQAQSNPGVTCLNLCCFFQADQLTEEQIAGKFDICMTDNSDQGWSAFDLSRVMKIYVHDVTHNTGVRQSDVFNIFHINQRVYKVMLPYKAQCASLTTIKYTFEQSFVCVYAKT